MKVILIISLLIHKVVSVSVVISKGEIIGQKATDGNYSTFFGVPYAQVNENKPFENTLGYPSFSTPFRASDPSIKCPQVIPSVGGVIQCLTLNIYVPNTNTTNLPVFVWFQGTSHNFGCAGKYNATHLVREGIIVVIANYRLSPYGFLCITDLKNQGLKDQGTALKWIKKNIQVFGGDPKKVTIGGQGWEAAAIDYLINDGGEFQQAIMQSGSRYSFGVRNKRNNTVLIKLALRLGYNTTKWKNALKFLNKANPIDVMQATKDLGIMFGICDKFRHSLTKKNLDVIKKIPIVIGYNSKEAIEDVANKNDSYYANVRELLINDYAKMFAVTNSTLRTIVNITLNFYLGEKNVSSESMMEIVDLLSDLRVNYGVERSVVNYLKLGNEKVYKYVFSFTGSSAYENSTDVGTSHEDALSYLFERGKLKTEEQFRMRRWLVKMWTNFIKYGDPTPNHGEDGWLPSNLTMKPYLNIDSESKMRYHVNHQRMAFWDLMWAGYSRYLK